MSILLNILWIIFGGFIICIEYIISSVALMVTIIGIPFGLQSIKLASLALFPFGAKVKSKPPGHGCLNFFMNVLWIIFGGIWIFLSHLIIGALLCITIIGIPFGLQHFKLAGLSFTPFGKEISY